MTTSSSNHIGAALCQTHQLFGKPVPLIPNATLNTALGVLVDTETSAPHKLQYFGISNKGAPFTTGADGIQIREPSTGQFRHGNLRNNVPFVLRHESNDLTPTERARYRFRRLVVYNGERYFAYYLRWFDPDLVTIQQIVRTIVDGVVTDTPFEPELSDLFITPLTGTYTSSGVYVGTQAVVTFNFTEADVIEYRNATNIIWGDGYDFIETIGLFTGVDVNVTANDSGEVARTEAAQVMLHSAFSERRELHNPGSDFTLSIDMGIIDPLYSIADYG